ncbi:hypothetical protein MKW94_021528 [Papaver nudicaule]|uniref:Prolyl endopeptidase n=1 Tax=Papaver nudicaule TaxID=74823 RepID=A0AA41RWU3_PAPNU|nr:hypothetical protein [Papaver nudicaule]
MEYPVARRDESVVDDYHGVCVSDPYRCLDAEAEVLIDPNGLSEDETVALKFAGVSEDAKYVAYGLSSSGSDWVSIKVMRFEDKFHEPHTLSWVKFSSITWTHDNKGFFYGRYPTSKQGDQLDAGTKTNLNLNQGLYYHFLGTEQSEDVLCWKDPENPMYRFEAQVMDDGKHVLLYIEESCDPVNKLYYCDLSTLNGLEGFKNSTDMLPFVKLVDNFDASYKAVANDATQFTFLTNKDAPMYKLIRVDLKEPSVWTNVIEESEKDVLEDAYVVNGNQILVSYLSDAKNVLQIRELKTGGLLHQLPIEIGTVWGVSGRRRDSEVFIKFTSFLTPGIIYRCNLAVEAPEMKIFRKTVVSGFDHTEFQVNQAFVPSKDGTSKIPLFIVSKKNIILDGSHPCLLYGYGGFNSSLTPTFNVSRAILTRHLGAVFCIANIRGGGEYGKEWHKAGSLAKKQNCFDDFISAAEYLVSAGYTQSKKLCIEGASNGGLLAAACVNQRPDLFGCALAHVGVMDMLRFHKFTIGHAWISDFGCSDKEEEFQWLINLENSPQTNPIIVRIESKAGHGCGRPIQKTIDEAADRYSFMAKMLGASWIN